MGLAGFPWEKDTFDALVCHCFHYNKPCPRPAWLSRLLPMLEQMVGLVSASAFSKMWEFLHVPSWRARTSLGGDAVPPSKKKKKSASLQSELPSGVSGAAVAGGLASPCPCFWPRPGKPQGRCSAGAGMFSSRLRVQSPSRRPLLPARALLCWASLLLSWAVNCSPWYAGRSRQEWESCLWQESGFIAPSEMSRW